MGGFAETEEVSCVSFMGDSSGSLSAERSSVDSSVDSSVGSVGGTLVVSSVEGGLVHSRWSLEQSAASRSPPAGDPQAGWGQWDQSVRDTEGVHTYW